MLDTVEAIATRRGIGNLLAEGSVRAAKQIGHGAEDLTIQVKGLDTGMHEPRLKKGLGLGYAVSPFGADHVCNVQDERWSDPNQVAMHLGALGFNDPIPANDLSPKKVELLKAMQLQQIMVDSLVMCTFFPYNYPQLLKILAGVTGWDTNIAEQKKVSERTLTAARLFNAREGFTTEQDKLPPRFFQPKIDGALSNQAIDRLEIDQARRYYYTLMGWNAKTGVPRPEKLEELGLPNS